MSCFASNDCNGQDKPLLLSLQPKSVPKHFKRISWSLCQHIFLISQIMLTPWEVIEDQEGRIPENSLEFGNYVTRWFLMQGSYTFSPGDIRQCMETCLVLTVSVWEAVNIIWWLEGRMLPLPYDSEDSPSNKERSDSKCQQCQNWELLRYPQLVGPQDESSSSCCFSLSITEQILLLTEVHKITTEPF